MPPRGRWLQCGDGLSLFGELCGIFGLQVFVPLVVVFRAQGAGGLVLPLDLAKALHVKHLVAGDVPTAVRALHHSGVPNLTPLGKEPVGEGGIQAVPVGILMEAAVFLGGFIGAVLLSQGGEGIRGGVSCFPLIQQPLGLLLGGGQLILSGQGGGAILAGGGLCQNLNAAVVHSLVAVGIFFPVPGTGPRSSRYSLPQWKSGLPADGCRR